MSNCSICKQPIAPGDDCGGDCTSCMAEAGDLECIVTMYERLKRHRMVEGVTEEMISAGLSAIVTDYRAENEADEKVTVERAMKVHGFHHPIDGREMVRAIVEAAFAAEQALAARPSGLQIVGYMDPAADFLLPRAGECVLMSKVEVCLWRAPQGVYTKPIYASREQAE